MTKISRCTMLLVIALASFAAPDRASAITISQAEFVRRGGTVAAAPSTLPIAFEALRLASQASQFLAVGTLSTHLGTCTATWVGDTPEDDSIYVLTAAHCVDIDGGNVVAAGIHASFRDGQERLIASGFSIYGVPAGRHRWNPPAIANAPNDLAVLTMPRVAPSVDQNGQPLKPAALFAGRLDAGTPITLIGYGGWAVDGVGDATGGPADGPRRALGNSAVSDSTQMPAAPPDVLLIAFDPAAAHQWARGSRASPGLDGDADAGAPLWQQHAGQWSIVGTLSSATRQGSWGTPVSTHLALLQPYTPEIHIRAAAVPIS